MKFVIILAVTTIIFETWVREDGANALRSCDLNQMLEDATDLPRIIDEGPWPFTDLQIKKFTECLLKADKNNVYSRIKVRYQGRSKFGTDAAPQPLIVIKDKLAREIPTISRLYPLYNNYIKDTSVAEHVIRQETAEETRLLDVLLATPVINMTMYFLASKAYVGYYPENHRKLLKLTWFTMYPRGHSTQIGSSGFENVFIGELKRGQISGLNNWVFFASEEAKKRANYYGYIRKLELGKGAILKFHYKWNNVVQPAGSMFIGTSPELEMALYTMCFMTHPNEKCRCRMNGKNFNVRVRGYKYNKTNVLGGAYPEI